MAALAGIGAMPDTIEDRAAVIRMRRRAQGETVAPYRVRRDGPQLGILRKRLNEWIAPHLAALTSATPEMPLEDRAADTWEPMIALADLAGGTWPRAARKAAVALTSDRDAGDEGSTPTRLLADCNTMGYVRKTPAGSWKACWRDATGRQPTKTFPTKREATAFLATIETARHTGTCVDPYAAGG
jgi:hypothetical protein